MLFNNCFGPDQEPPNMTEYAQELRKKLKLIMFAQILFGFIYIFISAFTGIYMLLSALILWCAIKRANFCSALFYIIISMINLFQELIMVGTFFMRSNKSTDEKIFIYAQILGILFYLVAIYYSFQAYKEFKAIQYETLGGSGQMMGSFGMMGNTNTQSNINNTDLNQRNPQYNQQLSNMNSGVIGQPQSQTSSNQNETRGYVPFSGEGHIL